jgi:hypothetical protein
MVFRFWNQYLSYFIKSILVMPHLMETDIDESKGFMVSYHPLPVSNQYRVVSGLFYLISLTWVKLPICEGPIVLRPTWRLFEIRKNFQIYKTSNCFLPQQCSLILVRRLFYGLMKVTSHFLFEMCADVPWFLRKWLFVSISERNMLEQIMIFGWDEVYVCVLAELIILHVNQEKKLEPIEK